MDRKDVWKLLAVGGAAAAGAALAHRLATERWQLSVTRATFAMRNLPPALDGVTVAHLSDLHIGHVTPASFARKAVRTVAALKPDIVVMTGDYVDDVDIPVGIVTDVLSRLEAPLGAYAVLGNHDHWIARDDVSAALTDAGVRVLRNEAAAVSRGDGPLWIVGLDDTACHREDWHDALRERGPGEPAIVLSHSPDVLPRAHDMDIDLVLAGHTHGGQIRLPIIGAPHAPTRLSPRCIAGNLRMGHTRMYVSRGIGMTLFPVRFGCPPEVGIYTLRRPLRTRFGNPVQPIRRRSI